MIPGEISLVLAMTPCGVIGRDGGLPWPHNAEDMKHFASLTKGSHVVMGRKTWDSLPDQFRPLPYRSNFVVSRSVTQPEFRNVNDPTRPAAGAHWHPTLESVLVQYDSGQIDRTRPLFVIGGGEIFREALPHADAIYLTRMKTEYIGDTYFRLPRYFFLSLVESGVTCDFHTYYRLG